MKKLILIITLTTSLQAFSQDIQPDYYDHKTDQELKEKEKFANQKILIGVFEIVLGVAVITFDEEIENKKVLYVAGGASIGKGIGDLSNGIVEKIEVRKVKRKRNKNKN